MSFAAILLWDGLKSENGASLLSPSGIDKSGILFNLVIGTVLPPGKRV